MIIPNISHFVKNYVINRKNSFFLKDLDDNKNELKKQIYGKSVLVIGGAGSIGSSFIKALLNYNPNELIVVDTNENGLTELTRNLRSDSKIQIPKKYLTYPMSFSSDVFYKMFKHHGSFDIIANFAAHKHVRSEKDSFSIEAMIRNNVLEAKRFLDFLKLNKPSHFFCVSTDKAANPVNIMGASKKLMEDVIMSYREEIKITTARFANVAFSNGSLLYGYLERLFKRQPISCPSNVKRFFVSQSESGEICLLTCILGKSGDIFFPKLGKDDLISFKDITLNFFKYLNKEIKICNSENQAKKLALNLNDNSKYPVYFFKSDTSGEKLYEEFYTKDDELILDRFNSIGIIANSIVEHKNHLESIIKKIEFIFNKKSNNKSDIIKLMNDLIPDFDHIDKGKNLDEKM